MSYDKLRADILAARDRREALVVAAIESSSATVVVASLNIPGAVKCPAGARSLFALALRRVRLLPCPIRLDTDGVDSLGPFAVFVARWQAHCAKRACAIIEGESPEMRLLDLDVYDAGSGRIGRRELDLGSRRCFLCSRPAAECMRLARHSQEDVQRHVATLLGNFQRSEPC